MTILLITGFVSSTLLGIIAMVRGQKKIGILLLSTALLCLVTSLVFVLLFMNSNM